MMTQLGNDSRLKRIKKSTLALQQQTTQCSTSRIERARAGIQGDPFMLKEIHES